jgi:hypothetical protein
VKLVHVCDKLYIFRLRVIKFQVGLPSLEAYLYFGIHFDIYATSKDDDFRLGPS